VHDHIVVGNGRCFSFRLQGLLGESTRLHALTAERSPPSDDCTAERRHQHSILGTLPLDVGDA
jgi:hypothetical protein